MKNLFASRINTIPKSFIREILKVTQNPDMISFAGGLPNPRFFPVREIKETTLDVLAGTDVSALQYSTTEGYQPLREYIAKRYQKRKLSITADEILITNGSQQGLDLIGKVFINKGDRIAIEKPAYLGAIQAFSVYEPQFCPIPLLNDGVDINRLETELSVNSVKLFHTVINFQNPSGITYSENKRRELTELLKQHNTIAVEDDPYSDLRFSGTAPQSMRSRLNGKVILLGSFSKTIAPGLRLGWICAKREIMDKLVTAKQASDLHSNSLCQKIVHQYLINNDVDKHIETIINVYKKQRDVMITAIDENFPSEVIFTKPEGGMFLWVTLPEQLSALELFKLAVKENVAFVPGTPFYVDNGGKNNMRLNFSNADENTIKEGIKRLGLIIRKLLVKKNVE
ncbi:MAG: PLP-dependent aminotransferase family protein [Sedimentisphaerales bacterium]|nr:PLP-dependent aminotransferase family protein [Sedimentisphaerales bacterium]